MVNAGSQRTFTASTRRLITTGARCVASCGSAFAAAGISCSGLRKKLRKSKEKLLNWASSWDLLPEEMEDERTRKALEELFEKLDLEKMLMEWAMDKAAEYKYGSFIPLKRVDDD